MSAAAPDTVANLQPPSPARAAVPERAWAVRMNGVGKQYRIGGPRYLNENIREDVMNWLAGLFGRSRTKSKSELFWALQDINLEIEQGATLGIIGRNGAGKSTLLKILSRITPPTAGTLRFRGRLQSLLEVGTGFHRELTGLENIYLNGAILGMRRAEINEQRRAIVEFSGIERFLNTPVKFYSSGMYVRLAFAVAAHLRADILIVDEVLAVGDAEFQKKCLGKMQQVARTGRTVIFVSHNMAAVQSLCDRTLWLHDGRIRAMGATDEIIGQYVRAHSRSLRVQEWTDPAAAPGNDRLRLREIRLETGEPNTADITTLTPIRVIVGFDNLIPGMPLRVHLVLYTADGTCVFESTTLKEPHWEGRGFPAGRFRTTCEIPASLLNEATYRARIIFGDGTGNHVFNLEEGLVFDVIDASDRPGHWHGRWHGVVRPELQWRTEFLDPLGPAS